MIDRNELIADLHRAQMNIDDDTLIEGGDGYEQGIEYTLACDDDQTGYAAQTGDNSFTGAAYSFPHWAVSSVCPDSDLPGVADDLLEQLAELMPEQTA